jgi:hypothetical protein
VLNRGVTSAYINTNLISPHRTEFINHKISPGCLVTDKAGSNYNAALLFLDLLKRLVCTVNQDIMIKMSCEMSPRDEQHDKEQGK